MYYDLVTTEDWGEESPLSLSENRYSIDFVPVVELHPSGKYDQSFIHFYFKDHPGPLAIDVPITMSIIDCDKLIHEQYKIFVQNLGAEPTQIHILDLIS